MICCELIVGDTVGFGGWVRLGKDVIDFHKSCKDVIVCDWLGKVRDVVLVMVRNGDHWERY